MKHFIPLPKNMKRPQDPKQRAGPLSGCTQWNHLAPRFPVEEHFELVSCGVSCIDELYDHYSCIQRFMMYGFSFVCLFWKCGKAYVQSRFWDQVYWRKGWHHLGKSPKEKWSPLQKKAMFWSFCCMHFMLPNKETQYVTTPRLFWLAPRLCSYIFSFRVPDGCGPECFTTASDG